jgi:16S rRNA (uracil1498-N3)-methyltransferase
MPGHFTFYCNKIQENTAYFDETESKHAIQVLRYGVGDILEFTDGCGTLYKGAISAVSKHGFEVNITERFNAEKPMSLRLYTAILKSGDRMEWAVEKCTELGVSSLVFFSADNGERWKVNLPRMQKVALSAMKQSHGVWLPEIRMASWGEILKETKGEPTQSFIAYCGDLKKQPISTVQLPANILIGPEGDFSKKEMESALDAGIQPLDLGHRILRTETAMVAAVAAVQLG